MKIVPEMTYNVSSGTLSLYTTTTVRIIIIIIFMFVAIKNKSATLAHSSSSAAVFSKRVSRLLAKLAFYILQLPSIYTACAHGSCWRTLEWIFAVT